MLRKNDCISRPTTIVNKVVPHFLNAFQALTHPWYPVVVYVYGLSNSRDGELEPETTTGIGNAHKFEKLPKNVDLNPGILDGNSQNSTESFYVVVQGWVPVLALRNFDCSVSTRFKI